MLRFADGTRQRGTAGSWCYIGACADSPWLPAHSLDAATLEAGGQELTLTISEAHGFVRWNARYADAKDESGEEALSLASGGDGKAPLTSASFAGPPAGSSVLAVQLDFGEELGDATYYWHIVVP